MALNRSPELKVVIVQIVCVVESQSETAWALPNLFNKDLGDSILSKL